MKNMETLSPLKSYLGLKKKVPDHQKIQISKKSKPAFKNRDTPTRYERERAAMKNKARKVLNLEERFLAIRLYHENPVYQRVASALKCSWEQIRNVIANRDDILRYYGECQTVTPKDSPQYARNKKINFLGNVTYEFVKRAYYHRSAVLNDDVVLQRATKIRDALKIPQFFTNQAWIADFKRVYNIDWNHLDRLVIIGKPPQSLDIIDLIGYCKRMVAKSFTLIGEVPKQVGRKEMKNDEGDDGDGDDDGGDVYGEAASGGGFGGVYGESDSMLVDNYDDVPVVNEIDDFAGMYPSISGEVEMHEDEAETITPHNYDDATKSNASRTASQQDTTSTPKSSTHLIADVQIKEEQRSRSNSPTLNLESSTSANARKVQVRSTDDLVASPEALEQTTRDSINTYADAMRALSPLEDFALQHEDFGVMNLLTQLAVIFEKGAKRKPERRNF